VFSFRADHCAHEAWAEPADEPAAGAGDVQVSGRAEQGWSFGASSPPDSAAGGGSSLALARRLLIRLYVMLRDQIDDNEFCRRGRARRDGPELPDTPV
jgi:hypothetical protein